MYVYKQNLYGMMMGHIKLLSIIVICKLPHEQFDLVIKNNMTYRIILR